MARWSLALLELALLAAPAVAQPSSIADEIAYENRARLDQQAAIYLPYDEARYAEAEAAAAALAAAEAEAAAELGDDSA